VYAAAAGAPPAFAGSGAPEAALRPAPPPVFAIAAPDRARSGVAGVAAAGHAAEVHTSAGIVHVTVRIER